MATPPAMGQPYPENGQHMGMTWPQAAYPYPAPLDSGGAYGHSPYTSPTGTPYLSPSSMSTGSQGGFSPQQIYPNAMHGFINPMANVHDVVRSQMEYYFSDVNLIKDVYFRRHMNHATGYVHLSVICGFSRMRKLMANEQLIIDALGTANPLVECSGQHVRRRIGWQRWVMTEEQTLLLPRLAVSSSHTSSVLLPAEPARADATSEVDPSLQVQVPTHTDNHRVPAMDLTGDSPPKKIKKKKNKGASDAPVAAAASTPTKAPAQQQRGNKQQQQQQQQQQLHAPKSPTTMAMSETERSASTSSGSSVDSNTSAEKRNRQAVIAEADPKLKSGAQLSKKAAKQQQQQQQQAVLSVTVAANGKNHGAGSKSSTSSSSSSGNKEKVTSSQQQQQASTSSSPSPSPSSGLKGLPPAYSAPTAAAADFEPEDESTARTAAAAAAAAAAETNAAAAQLLPGSHKADNNLDDTTSPDTGAGVGGLMPSPSYQTTAPVAESAAAAASAAAVPAKLHETCIVRGGGHEDIAAVRIQAVHRGSVARGTAAEMRAARAAAAAAAASAVEAGCDGVTEPCELANADKSESQRKEDERQRQGVLLEAKKAKRAEERARQAAQGPTEEVHRARNLAEKTARQAAERQARDVERRRADEARREAAAATKAAADAAVTKAAADASAEAASASAASAAASSLQGSSGNDAATAESLANDSNALLRSARPAVKATNTSASARAMNKRHAKSRDRFHHGPASGAADDVRGSETGDGGSSGLMLDSLCARLGMQGVTRSTFIGGILLVVLAFVLWNSTPPTSISAPAFGGGGGGSGRGSGGGGGPSHGGDSNPLL